MENHIKEIIRMFGLKVNKLIPLRAVYLIDSNEGYYCLKKLNYKEDKLRFILGVKDHLMERGFTHIDQYRRVHGKPFMHFKGELYMMTKYIVGRECDFDNPLDVHEAARNLAKFHLASEGFIAPGNCRIKSDLGKWTKTYLKRCDDLIYIKNLVKMKSEKNNMDMLFLRNVDAFHRVGRSSIEMLQPNGYFEQVEQEEKRGSVCHHDYTYHNIIIDHGGNHHIIDFDYCKHELMCYDLAQFIMVLMKRCHWDFSMALEILEVYDQVRPLSDVELKLMVSLFQFPQRFWRTASRFYYENDHFSGDACMENLAETIDSKPFLMDFLQQYYKKFL